jgi:Leucine-rich repeat (LRR) protein
MKTKLLFITTIAFVFFNINLKAQTSVPDAAFEQELINLGYDTGTPNGSVPTANISGVTTLYLAYLGIKDLTGIEDFAALENLTFQGNQAALISIDLTANSNLKTLSVFDFPNLTAIDITGLSNLTDILLSNLVGITTLDYSNMSSLNKVQISRLSNLSTVNVTGLSPLTEFSISNSPLMSSLDLSPLTSLNQLVLSNNTQLSTVNLATGTTAAISYVQLNGNTLLTCVEVDAGVPLIGMPTWNQSNGFIFNEDCSNPATYVPDDNFEAYLEANSMGNGIANDDKVFTNNINSVTDLDVSNQSISDLTGIDGFLALINLNALSNTITAIDVSKNLVLDKLILNNNNLSTIDVSQNTNLKQLWVRQNNLTFLDVSKNTNLEWLISSVNAIQNLDLSLNTALSFIEIHTNDLHTLNLKNVSSSSLYFDAQLNSSLTCIEVDSPTAWTSAFSSQIDNTASFNSNCSYPETSVPDAAFENYLETHDRDRDVVNLGHPTSMGNGIANDGKVFTHRINTVTLLDVSSVGLSILTGLEDFRDLEIFGAYGGNNGLVSADFSNNLKLKSISFTANANATSVIFGSLPDLAYIQLGFCNIANIDLTGLPNLREFKEFSSKLTTLDVTSNPKLEILGVQGGILTALDVSANPDLKTLSVTGNQITNLDVSNNPKIEWFNVSNNQLTSLNLKNGFNTLIYSQVFSIANNPGLTCIEVDNVAYSTTNWTNIDAQHIFNTTCANSLTYVPDAAFETYLETHAADGSVVPFGDPTSMGNGTGTTLVLDGYVFTNRIDTVTTLNVQNTGGNVNTANNPILVMTGIEDFIALQVLHTSTNNIASIDVSNLPYLYNLKVQSNPITTIDVSQNSNLLVLDIGSTSIGNIDVMQNLRLESLNIDYTPTATIDISKNLNLKTFSAENVPLTQIDLSQNSKLEYLELRNNSLSTLDFSSNLLLQILVLEAAPVNSLDLSLYNKLTQIRLNNNSTLSQLNLKNTANTNIPTSSFDIINNPSLTCIEVDDVTYSNTNWTNTDSQHVFNTTCANSLTYVPDNVLEAYLETHDANGNVVALGASNSMGNGAANDDYVFTNRINTVTNLQVPGLSISDMSGIEDFAALKLLYIYQNQLTSINVSQNVLLEEFAAFDNAIIGSLDFTSNTALSKLYLRDNQITDISVINNTLLTILQLTNNSNINLLDVSNNINLEKLQVGGTNISNLNIETNVLLSTLNIWGTGLTTLNISKNILLEYLSTGSTQIPTIDLSQNTILKQIQTGYGALSSIDLSNAPLLELFYLHSSTLKNIDLSGNPNLIDVNLVGNSLLESVNLKNGNPTALIDFNAGGCPKLICIQVDDVAVVSAFTFWIKEAAATYSTDCSTVWTVMTNPATTSALLAITGLDADNDGNITLAEAAAFTGPLDLSSSGITDVEGLQAFTSITTLDVSGNGITDLSPLTSSTFSIVAKSSEKTQTIAKTQTMALEEIVLSNNNFDVVDLSSLTNLKVVKLNDNPNLITVSIQNGNNGVITEFNSSNTPNLTCILVDDVNAGYLSSWTKDVKSTYVANEAQCRAEVLSIDNFDVTNNVSLYPNPVKDYLKIELRNQLEIQKIQIYNVIGKLVNETRSLEVDFTKLSKGIYLLKIITDKGIATKKVIKN